MRPFYFTLILAISICHFACTQPSRRFIRADNDLLRIVGRVQHAKDSVTLYWPATTIEVRFRGTEVSALLKDELGNNFFNIEIDGHFSKYIHLDTTKKMYQLASGLSDTVHLIRLIKRTEWDQGKSWFYGFEVDGDLLNTESKSRIIEFFGDSITAGYAIEDSTGTDSPAGKNTNNYNTYASLTARHFDADCYMTIKSGIGVLVSWFPLIMPQLYDRLDPQDSTSRWDFHRVQPDVVVVNLFQNDSWLVDKPDHPSFMKNFGKTKPREQRIINAYRDFIAELRKAYPKALIICSLGSMDAAKVEAPWRKYIDTAVRELNDPKIVTHFFPFIKRNGHPTPDDNRVMAESLIAFIHQKTGW